MRQDIQHVEKFIQAVMTALQKRQDIRIEDAVAILKQYLTTKRKRNTQLMIVEAATQFINAHIIFEEMLHCPELLDDDIEAFFLLYYLQEVKDCTVIRVGFRRLYAYRRAVFENINMKLGKIARSTNVLIDLMDTVQTQVPL